MRHLPDLDAVPGLVSVWCGPIAGPPAYQRNAEATHYAASTMKVAVLAALYAGGHDLDQEVAVHNEFTGVTGATFGLKRRHDQDDEVWRRVGHTATPRWLAARMVTHSSNLATNLLLERVGLPAVDRSWRAVGARHSAVRRGLGDTAAADAGITNEVTAADLARLFGAIARGELAGSDEMLATLLDQRRTEDLAAGLPAGTRVAHKNGWVMGVRHGAGVVFPADAPPFVLAVCLTTPWALNRTDDKACQIVSRIAGAAWENRHDLG